MPALCAEALYPPGFQPRPTPRPQNPVKSSWQHLIPPTPPWRAPCLPAASVRSAASSLACFDFPRSLGGWGRGRLECPEGSRTEAQETEPGRSLTSPGGGGEVSHGGSGESPADKM